MQSHIMSRHPPELTKKYPFINSTLSTTDAFTTSPATLTHWRSHQLEQREFISGWDPALLVPDLLILEPGGVGAADNTQLGALCHTVSLPSAARVHLLNFHGLAWRCLSGEGAGYPSPHTVGKFTESIEEASVSVYGVEQGGKAECMQAAVG